MNLKGTPLKGKDFENGHVLTTKSRSNAFYAWDTGQGIGKYLQGLKEGKILGTYCKKCDRTVVPPRVFCELCMGSNIEWRVLKDTGRINTFSICYVNWDASRVEHPHLPAVIEIDGATKGHGIMHVLDEVAPKDIKIGMKVKAVWKRKEERKGDITDIQYWKPL
ncbi:MAG: hypothetical protein A3B70_00745 [Deltaproteobacteria bacterium RIFCSPHIGHO2_02_FULL_40_11]|nr:MAG: hypothetical protein A3B70_00745 [Deltaproteobacteria bacterium RIFCSPHIGHO2_02_FULL_40_11]